MACITRTSWGRLGHYVTVWTWLVTVHCTKLCIFLLESVTGWIATQKRSVGFSSPKMPVWWPTCKQQRERINQQATLQRKVRCWAHIDTVFSAHCLKIVLQWLCQFALPLWVALNNGRKIRFTSHSLLGTCEDVLIYRLCKLRPLQRKQRST